MMGSTSRMGPTKKKQKLGMHIRIVKNGVQLHAHANFYSLKLY